MAQITTPDVGLVAFRQDVHKLLRRRVLEAMEIVLQEELSEALGSTRYERSESRRGYRNGSEKRTVTTSLGSEEIEIPRGRLFKQDGETAEFQSDLLPRYARRTRAVDDAVLGVYLAGGNTRRIRKALEPLLGSKHLSKSSVSRRMASASCWWKSGCRRTSGWTLSRSWRRSHWPAKRVPSASALGSASMRSTCSASTRSSVREPVEAIRRSSASGGAAQRK